MNACLPAEAPLADPDPLDPDRKAVDEVARILKAEHTELLFCFPINSLIDAATAAGIRPVVARLREILRGSARPVRIAQQRAAEQDGDRVPGGDDGLGLLGLVDQPDGSGGKSPRS